MSREHVISKSGSESAVDLGVRVSPLSGAGRATCRLMADLMFRDASTFEDGVLHSVPAMSNSGAIQFHSGTHKAVYVDLPDAEIANIALKARKSDVMMGFRPDTVTYVLPFVSRTLRAFPVGRNGTVRDAIARGLFLLRGRIFRNIPTRVELTARARNHGVSHYTMADTNDGMKTAAVAICAALSVLNGNQTSTGAFFLPQFTTLEPFWDKMKAIERDASLSLDLVLNRKSG